MKQGAKVRATVRAKRSRQTAIAAIARELLYGGTLARVWPAYLTPVIVVNDEYPLLLCVKSPAGLLTWRISKEEMEFFDWLDVRANSGERATDRTPILMALAEDGSLE